MQLHDIVSMCRLWRSALGTVVVLSAATAPCVSTAGQQPDRPPAQITLAGQVELARLVDTAAQRLKLNIDYDAAALKGQVTLRLDGALTDEELWALVNRVLAARGFTTIRQPGVATYSVLRVAEAASVAPIGAVEGPVQGPMPSQPAAGFQSIVVRAKHRPAKELVEQLGKSGPKAGASAGSATAVGDSGLIVISDLAPRVEQLTALLAVLDSPGARTVVEEIPLQNLGAAQMISLLTQLVAKRDAVSGEKTAGEVVNSPDGNSLLLVAPESASAGWKALIETLDRREPAQTQTYAPRHFPAKDVAKLIEQTYGKSGGGGGAGPGGGASGDARWKVVVDELTGSLIITGTPSQHESVRALIERLDGVPASARRPLRTFIIKHRPVTEIVETLDQLLRAGVLDGAVEVETNPAAPTTADSKPLKPDPAVFQMPPSPGTPPGTVGRPAENSGASIAGSSSLDHSRRDVQRRGGGAAADAPTFTVDKGSNSLIVVAEPRVLDQIETLLKTLDVRQPQVLLDVLLVTLSEGQTLDFGVELEKIDVSGDIVSRLSSLFGLGTRGGGGDRTGPDNAAGLTGVVLNPGDFSVVVRALETLNHGRALSMPQLLVGNNQQATLDSVVQQPFASVNASNTVSTTSFGGTKDAGTVVTIQPQIAEGDHLLLQYSVSLSSFLGAASSPTLPPARQQNRVQSVATIPDGSTVIVGGIDINNDSNTTSQVPVLGNIPIIGEAFKSRNLGNSHSRFYVFIRANILRNQNFDDLKYLSGRAAAAARVGDGFPEVKPQVIR